MLPRYVLLLLTVLAAACTFPDVDYSDGGPASCPGLTACTDAASSCAAAANGVLTDCTTQCHGGSGCIDKCSMDHVTALSACDTTCTSCAPASCAAAAGACMTASGM